MTTISPEMTTNETSTQDTGSDAEAPSAGTSQDPNTEAFLKARKSRNAAIALALFGFVVLLFAVTVVKMGPEVLSRPL